MKKKNTITIDELALMVKRGFDQTATKEDLMQCATKEDLMQCATKEDLMQCATKEDLMQLRTEMQDGFRGVNRRIDLLHEDISDLPDIREELKDHDGRLMRVERKVGHTT